MIVVYLIKRKFGNIENITKMATIPSEEENATLTGEEDGRRNSVTKQDDSCKSNSIPNDADISEARPRPRKYTVSRRIEYSDFKAHIITWNVASAPISAHDVESLFQPQEGHMLKNVCSESDIIVVGLQEAYQSLQDAVASNVPLVGKDPHIETFSTYICQQGFARLSALRLLGIVTMVFVKRPLLCYIYGVASCSTKTGLNGWLGNKGASSIRFNLGDVSLCFTNCHLVPHNENNERRVEELQEIFSKQVFETYQCPSTLIMEHDVVILFGDLNFRLEGKTFSEVVNVLESRNTNSLLDLDQLRREQIRGEESPSKLFCFMEMPLDFLPSYKYEPGTDNYDGGKGRAPAWCDRILWFTHERRLPKITDPEPRSIFIPDYYGMHMQPRISDHKAVSSGMTVSVDISDFIPRVIFSLQEWVAGVKGKIEFEVIGGTDVSFFDWVGLYPCDFASYERDYVFWIYTPASRGKASGDRRYARQLLPEQVPLVSGKYVLVYVSNTTKTVLGMSPIFRIMDLIN